MVMILSTILTGSLFAIPAPLSDTAPVCTNPSAPLVTLPLGTFEDSRLDLEVSLETLLIAVGQNAATDALRDPVIQALEHLRFFPERVALDQDADALITWGMLVVAASIEPVDPAVAEHWIDRAVVRQSTPFVLPAPMPETFVALYDNRVRALLGVNPATIRIDCEVDCAAYVDGHRVIVQRGKVTQHVVTPGVHDVWIFYAPVGTYSGTVRANFTELELTSNQQNCLDFPDPSALGLLPSPEEWWLAWSYAQRIEWALDCKKNFAPIQPQILSTLVEESLEHTRVLAQDSDFRDLRVRVALNLVELLANSGKSNEAIQVLDRVLRWADLLDSESELTAAVGKFQGLNSLYTQRQNAIIPRGQIEVDCRRCLAAVDGVVVEDDLIDVPVGTYHVEIFPRSPNGEAETFNPVNVWENETTVVPREPPVFARPIDLREEYKQSPLLQRWIWGTAGGVALTGGVAWSFGIAAGLAPGIRGIDFDEGSSFRTVRGPKVVPLGLLVTGATVVHAEVAAYLFSRMPPSRRPGIPMTAVGGGLIVYSGLAAGIGVWGAVSADQASKGERRARREADQAFIDDTDEYDDTEIKLYQGQQKAAMTVGVAGAVASGALLITGITLAVVGARRTKKAEREGIVLPARKPAYRRPGAVPIILGTGLIIASPAFIGLGLAAVVLELNKHEDGTRDSAIVGLGMGGAMVIGGAALVGVGLRAKRKQAGKKNRTAVVPSFAPHSVGLAVVGRF